MARPLSQEERDEIAKLCGEGKSANEIARLTGRSPSTVTKVANETGHRFGHSNLARAHEARSAYSAERRAELAAKLTERAEQLLDEMDGKFVAYSFGGRDNDYNEHEFESPPIDAKFTMIRAAREALRTVLDIDRHDNRNDENLSAVDAWMRSLIGEAVG
jgi:hypothetical protein